MKEVIIIIVAFFAILGISLTIGIATNSTTEKGNDKKSLFDIILDGFMKFVVFSFVLEFIIAILYGIYYLFSSII